jgi:serine/threonine-protein kinase
MIPRANEDFEDHDDKTTIDLVKPFDSSTELLELSEEPSTDASTKLLEPSEELSSAELLELSEGRTSTGQPLSRTALHEPSIDLAISHEAQLTVDPPTTIVRRSNFQSLPPGTIVGENYEIDTRLGAGAMGEVYAARHMGLGKRVAIKVIVQRLSEDEAAIGRFVTEARVLAQIQHPAIVTVEHVGELPDGRAYFVMEYLRGESLSERLSRGRVPLREALRILDQMARGLEAAHGSGVVHRDLKPDNTFLVRITGEKPAVKLLDFGLAKLATTRSKIEPRTERSESGIAIGTPMYMSPEQARGPDVDHRTDIYALGCVAYELILGARPFPQARTAPEIYAAHLHGSPSLPRSIWPEIPPQLDLILFAMLAKDPSKRPTLSQVRSVVTRLRASTPSQPAARARSGDTDLHASVPSQSTAPVFVRRRVPKRRARRAVIIALAIGALATGATLGAEIGTTINAKGNILQARSPNAPIRPPPPPIEHIVPGTSARPPTPIDPESLHEPPGRAP